GGSREPRWAMTLVLGGGAVVPFAVLVALWAVTLRDAAALSEPPARPALTVEVVGWRWWWEVRYPDAGAVTANEVHIPAGVPVRIRVLAGDVIHSFWVPELGGKMDMIPGRVNDMWIQADEPGVYRGQCAEYCGLQHANMAFFVFAHPPDEFDRWLAAEAADARAPSTALEARGQEVFVNGPCAGCHTIRGVVEAGNLGPDLTHFGSRRWIGAGTVRNNLQNLLAWIPRSDEIKPGNLMPPIPLSTEDLEAVAAYLLSLE
ncbi:MAG TPA: cytochrome c oxidase subunit II, partial [Actinomycetota bacterium]|nr:cytochrome c oxidase subunit II [Actinomycetota bacterium]